MRKKSGEEMRRLLEPMCVFCVLYPHLTTKCEKKQTPALAA